jgi:eukaryotic-like serine/threonine-protein kinase
MATQGIMRRMAWPVAWIVAAFLALHSGVCPSDMAPIAGLQACIDRFEAAVVKGAAVAKKGTQPAVLVSQIEAQAACAQAGKRLCTTDEWKAACAGPDALRKYAYGARYEPRRCHDRARSGGKSQKPLPTGSLPRCKTAEGVFDLSGNVWEWLADGAVGGATAWMIGGGYGNDDDDQNLSCNPKHPMGQPIAQKIEAVGFRCCKSVP